ncbi:uncharacterized protein I303_105056 [Kwoniella dejecticola CBS 10117]|uniref:Mitochondrial zinc maintenance protein 1, mitochondrial n=1 Tax=Kwoniella dejecticola CBS 10117 TaxID=1296121 RepID=A0A1A6A3L0_9TREE|nr:uncharacterized protein I303_05498 [Kwoniella dejecticola CBS 10117]OBR84639.1 hypothetical protein I303_05498 [Kwoniella dejecticola CBS 10117]
MSFPASLKPLARGAYRNMLRSSRITFNGDPERHVQMLSILRQTFSSPTLKPPASGSAELASPSKASFDPIVEQDQIPIEELTKRIEEWNEAAKFLRQNVVQGVQDEDGTWKLRVTEETELGDNASIREPPKLPTTPFPNRNKRRCTD